MADFTAKDVQALRQRTGVGMMDCKNALTEAGGDMDKAIEILREKGIAKAAKKASRVAAEGLVVSIIENGVGAVLEVNSETDFVAKNKGFIEFVNDVAKTIISGAPADVEALKALTLNGSDVTVEAALQEKVLSIGENIQIRRFVRLEGSLISYVHGDGKIGVMVKFDTDVAEKDGFMDYARSIAMQIAAVAPSYLKEDQVPASVIEKEKEILTQQAINEGKPANIAERMVMGRIKKFYKENCLVDQEFVKDSSLSISEYTANVAKELGGKIEILDFVRMEKGEGIEKREDNFADEIADMVK